MSAEPRDKKLGVILRHGKTRKSENIKKDDGK